MKKKRIGIIGSAATGEILFDGQTVSTRLWIDELGKAYTENSVCVIDTYRYKKKAVSVLWQWLVCMFSCSHIVIMLSGNGLKFFCPLLYYSNKVFKRKIFHRVIGGELDTFLKKNPECVKYINSFEANWVQSPSLVKKLEEIGVENAEYLENFRNITPIELPTDILPVTKPYKFCTFCRVSKAKGISLAIEAIADINRNMGKNTAVLHVYGPIEAEYSEEFNALIAKHSDCVEYKGSIPSAEAVGVLRDYYFHLFPTTWSGEGFPGTLLDCYNAGLPTVASDWAYNSEYISDGKTGYLYDWEKPALLYEKIKYAIENEKSLPMMRRCCIDESKRYKCDVIMSKIINRMGLTE